jgi:tRNA threonylcarbamoyladenosine biosynthesis protein TsaE
LRFLGWNELDDGLRLVEWPQRAPALAARADLQITLSYAQAGRNLDFVGLSERGRALASKLNS